MNGVLVTFATSSEGIELCRRFAGRAKVIAAGPQSARSVAPLFAPYGIRYVEADLTHSRHRRSLLFGEALQAGVSAVVHGPVQRRDGRRIHCEADAVRELLHLCERHPTVRRFVYRSSADVYRIRAHDPALIDDEHPLEASPLAPAWLRDRVEADLAACGRVGVSPLRLAVLRCAEVIGNGGQLRAWLDSEPCLRPLGFDPMVNVLSASDCVRAIALAAESDACGVFNVPGADTLPLSELAARAGRLSVAVPGFALRAVYALRGALRETRFDYRANARRFHFGGVLSGDRARKVLGYEPAVPISWPTDAAAPQRAPLLLVSSPRG